MEKKMRDLWKKMSIRVGMCVAVCLMAVWAGGCGCGREYREEAEMDSYVSVNEPGKSAESEGDFDAAEPTPGATETPGSAVTAVPTAQPAQTPTGSTTAAPTTVPAATTVPTTQPTQVPAGSITAQPTAAPVATAVPSAHPTQIPVQEPSVLPAQNTCPSLSVDGTKLVDASGNQVQLRGVSTHGLAWFPGYVNKECFRQLKEEWGANVVRLAMYTAEYGGYCSGGDKEAIKKLVKDGVEYATELGLYVIIDWHILSDGNPNTYVEEAKDFFKEISEAYGDYTNVLYEICNEPNGGTSWAQVKEYAQKVIPVIRENDEDGIILVGTPNWCQYVGEAAADPLTGYDNIMYTLHFYAATHTDWLRNNMVAAIDAGLPLFVSEYGICDASGNGNMDEYQAGEWVTLMDEYGVSYVAWNLSNKAETSAFFRPECSKVSGFGEEDLSASGKWVRGMLRQHAGIGDEVAPLPEATEAPVETTPVPEATEAPVETTPVPEATEAPVETTPVPEATKAPVETTPVPETTKEPVVSIPDSGDLGIELKLVNSWEQDGQSCYQFALSLTNNAQAVLENWNVALKFNQSITLVNGWNGNYQVEGEVLTVSPVEYNSRMDVGQKVSDIGFILQSGANLEMVAE